METVEAEIVAASIVMFSFACVYTVYELNDPDVKKDWMWTLETVKALIEFWPLMYALVRVRKKLADLPDAKLESVIFENLLVRGLSSLATIIYLSMESWKCIEEKESEDVFKQCGSIIVPQEALGGFLYAIFFMKAIIRPLTKYADRRRDIMTFDFSLAMVFQIFLIFTSFCCCLFLFGHMTEEGGEATHFVYVTAYVSKLSIQLALWIEIIFIVRAPSTVREEGVRNGGLQASPGDISMIMGVLENSAAESSADPMRNPLTEVLKQEREII